MPLNSKPLNPKQVRLFMCYVATHPEKLDEQRAEQWRKVTRLTPQQVGVRV